MKSPSLGGLVAERDSHLHEYFVEETPEFSAALDFNDGRCFFVGRTGSGKTALVRTIEHKFEGDKNVLCVKIKTEKAYLDAIIETQVFASVAEREQVSEIAFKLVWHYVIMTQILLAKYGPDGPKRSWRVLFGNDHRAYRFLERAQELTRDGRTLTDTFLGLIEEVRTALVTLKTREVKAREISPTNFRELIKESESFFDNGFWEVIKGQKVYILFDDLDQGWDPNSDGQQKLLCALFRVISEYNYRDRIKPVVCLRTNILHGLRLKQREKFSDHVFTISWTGDLLKSLLERRVAKFHGISPAKMHKEFFSGNVSGVELFDYILSRTLMRPRDVIEFVERATEIAIKEKTDLVFARHVKEAELTYSKNRVAALHDEWRYLFPGLETFFELLGRQFEHNEVEAWLSPKEFKNKLESLRDDVLTEPNAKVGELIWINAHFPDQDPRLLVETLYSLGVIVVKNQGEADSVDSHPNMPRVDLKTTIRIHPMFCPFIQHLSREAIDPWNFDQEA